MIVYCIRFIIVMMACGCMFASFRQVLSSISRENRFFAGCCSSVLFLPLFDYVLALIWPGVPMTIMQYFPLICAICYLLWNGNYKTIADVCRTVSSKIMGCIKKDCQDIIQRENASIRINGLLSLFLKIVGIALLTFLMSPIIKLTGVYADYPLYGSDESHYMMQARYFAEDRVSLEIDNYHGEKEGTVLIDDHGPLWPVYLGDALTFAGVEARNSFIIHFAQIITAYLMLLMLANTAGAIMGWVSASLSVVVSLCYRYIMHFPLYGSRDGFRFIALLLYMLIIYDLLYRALSPEDDSSKEMEYAWSDYFFLAVVTYLCMNGHGGNVYFIFCLFFPLAAVAAMRFKKPAVLLCLSLSTGVGVFICLIKNLLLYKNTGSFRSYTSFVYKGTAVEKILQSQKGIESIQEKQPVLSSFTPEERKILLFSLILLTIAVLYCIIAMLVLKSKNGKSHSDLRKLEICCLIVISMFIPLTGVLNFIAGDVQSWFLNQLRYRMYIYLTCGLLCGVCCAFFLKKNSQTRYLFMGLAVIPLYIAASTMRSYYPTLYTNYRSYEAVAFFEKTATAADQLITDGYTLSNDQVISWYLDKPAKLTICNYVVPLFQANTQEEISSAIENMKIQVFLFDWRGQSYYKQLPFYTYLLESESWQREIYPYGEEEIEMFYEKTEERG